MKRSKYTTEQIIGALKQAQGGVKVEDICRRLGISKNTFYAWRTKFSGMEINEAKRLRELEDENRRLKRVVADLTLDKQILQDALSGKL